MAQALYRKYRPASFKELVDQNPIKITLQNEVENGRIAHAYLFSGPRGVGKTTTARLLAKAVSCTSRKGAEPCLKCDMCKEIAAGRSIDLIEIDAASHTGVDNVRENIIENARFTPQRAAYKVFVIDEVHMLSTSAFNALLKTLEEPPEHVIFILATTEIHRVPETIISRCQRFDFKRVSVDDLVKRLNYVAKEEKVTVDDALLKNIARRSEGSVRDAEVLLGQIIALGDKKITEEKASIVLPRANTELLVEFFRDLVQQDTAGAITMVNRLVDEGVNLQDFIKDFIEFLRETLLLKVGGITEGFSNLALDDKTISEVKKYSDTINIPRLVKMVETFRDKARELKYAQIIQLPLELAVLELSDSAKDNTEITKIPSTPSSGEASTADKSSQELSENKGDETGLNYSKISKSWPKIVKQLSQQDRSIGLSLKVGLLYKVQKDTITIAYQYKFHADRVGNRMVKSKIEDIIEKALKKKYRLLTIILDEEEFAKLNVDETGDSSSGNIVDQVLQAFGGEIVEEE